MRKLFDESTGLLIKAIHFSAAKHRDQRRKDEAHSRYINHPLDVTRRLWETGEVRDQTTLISAVLHDTLEDTQTTPLEIGTLFGEEVLSAVLEVTDDKSLPRLVRKRLQIEHAPNISQWAKLIKLADKSCNLYDLIHSPPRRWSLERQQHYLLWTEQVVAGLRGTNLALEQTYNEILKTGKLLLKID
ncbi:MAG TPA: HD domain-containing protein [Anaerolineales bacterium]|jgi:guanosine-3',5'-bis(diphosphate) 3'-pyrophosphohydrolase